MGGRTPAEVAGIKVEGGEQMADSHSERLERQKRLTRTKLSSLRWRVIATVALVAMVGIAFGVYAYRTYQIPNSIPCVRPAGGFLIIASSKGYNESVDHGVPQTHWPVINVQLGQTVNMVVCNTDIQAHGFQIAHYFDSTTNVVRPNQSQRFSFSANQVGTFQIYSGIFDSLEAFEQSGQLIVSS
ncbi:MAG: hypothetical protein HY296_02870 [Thaumarchaeota archaeon]|nr:hypothetical protein [Nitrososphaerota archaeon]